MQPLPFFHPKAPSLARPRLMHRGVACYVQGLGRAGSRRGSPWRDQSHKNIDIVVWQIMTLMEVTMDRPNVDGYFFVLCVAALLGGRVTSVQPATDSIVLEDFQRGDGRLPKDLQWDSKRQEQYSLVKEGNNIFLRSSYKPVMGEASNLERAVDWDPATYPILRWQWRVHKFPVGGQIIGLADSDTDAAAQIYVLWGNCHDRLPLSCYKIKYFWATATEGAGQADTKYWGHLRRIIIRSSGPTNMWQTETRDIAKDFGEAFPSLKLARVQAIAVLSDGDFTHSDSEADYDDFIALKKVP